MPQYSLKYRIESKYHKWMWWLFITVVYIKIPQYYHHCLMAECRISRCNKIILTWICYCTNAETLCLWITKMLNGWRGVEESRTENRIGAPAFHVKGWGWVGVGVSWGTRGALSALADPAFMCGVQSPSHIKPTLMMVLRTKAAPQLSYITSFCTCVCVCVCVCMQHLRGRKSIRAPWQIRGWCRVARVTVFALL